MNISNMNSPAKSKINWTALATLVVGVLVATGIVPEEAKEPLMELTLLVVPVLIITFRTWFTEPRS